MREFGLPARGAHRRICRSALKPLQFVAMLWCGLDLDDELLVLACASHAGEPAHLARVQRILAAAGRTADDLQNTLGLPLGEQAALSAPPGRAPADLARAELLGQARGDARDLRGRRGHDRRAD